LLEILLDRREGGREAFGLAGHRWRAALESRGGRLRQSPGEFQTREGSTFLDPSIALAGY
jgi:hypothetical protein